MKECCRTCAWNYSIEQYDLCEAFRLSKKDDCEMFYEYVPPKDKSVCEICGRNKDPGKCWWCGNE